MNPLDSRADRQDGHDDMGADRRKQNGCSASDYFDDDKRNQKKHYCWQKRKRYCWNEMRSGKKMNYCLSGRDDRRKEKNHYCWCGRDGSRMEEKHCCLCDGKVVLLVKAASACPCPQQARGVEKRMEQKIPLIIKLVFCLAPINRVILLLVVKRLKPGDIPVYFCLLV